MSIILIYLEIALYYVIVRPNGNFNYLEVICRTKRTTLGHLGDKCSIYAG